MMVVCCSVTIALLFVICITITILVEKCHMHLVSQKHGILTIKSFAQLKHNCTNKTKVKNMYFK